MNYHQLMQLRSNVEVLPRPAIKNYVSTITSTNVIPLEGLMVCIYVLHIIHIFICKFCTLLTFLSNKFQEFSQEFTRKFLMQFLMDEHLMRHCIQARSQLVSVGVMLKLGSPIKYCRMNLQADGKAQIIPPGWAKVVEAFNLKEGDVCMFSFTDERKLPPRLRHQWFYLKLEILKIEEYYPVLLNPFLPFI